MRRTWLAWGFGSAVAAAGCSSTVSIETAGPTTAGAGGSATTSSSATTGAGGGSAAATIALGGWHTCAVKTDGSLWCWGNDQHGELGVGTTCSAPPNSYCGVASPVEVTALGHSVRDAALGLHDTCAVKTDGSLWCWGANDHGQLGDGTTADKSSPVKVAPLGNAVSKVSLGTLHVCALLTDGSLWCWGDNEYGQLGDGTLADRSSPAPVTALGNAAMDLAVGGGDSCARKKDGSTWCWGLNVTGQIPLGTTCSSEPCVKSPVEVTALGKGVKDVGLGGSHGCARQGDDSVWCWGLNYWGQLGDGTVEYKYSPVAVGGLGGGVVEIALGGYNTCARKADGALWCWGSNGHGQLGAAVTVNCQDNGLYVPCSTKPLAIAGLGGVVEVAIGDGHICVRKADGSLWCWGDNYGGQLGDGTKKNRTSPAPVNW